jgi:hypothetical protein
MPITPRVLVMFRQGRPSALRNADQERFAFLSFAGRGRRKTAPVRFAGGALRGGALPFAAQGHNSIPVSHGVSASQKLQNNPADAAKLAKLGAQAAKLAAELEKAEAKAAGKPAKTASASKGGGKAAPASDFSYDASADGKGVVIKKYTGKGGKVVIPGEIEGLPVVELESRSFIGQNYDDPGADLTAVVIPASVKTINGLVFVSCPNLTSVTIQGSGVVIGGGAFASCTELAELVFPDGDKVLVPAEYGYDAFKNCKKLPLAMRSKLKDMGFTDI